MVTIQPFNRCGPTQGTPPPSIPKHPHVISSPSVFRVVCPAGTRQKPVVQSHLHAPLVVFAEGTTASQSPRLNGIRVHQRVEKNSSCLMVFPFGKPLETQPSPPQCWDRVGIVNLNAAHHNQPIFPLKEIWKLH